MRGVTRRFSLAPRCLERVSGGILARWSQITMWNAVVPRAAGVGVELGKAAIAS